MALLPIHRKVLAGTTAGLVAIAVLGGVGYAASDHGGTPALIAAVGAATVTPAATVSATSAPNTSRAQSGTKPVGHASGLKTVLDQLVTEGKITQAQEDLIVQRLQSQAGKGAGPRQGFAGHGGFLGSDGQSLATLLGISTTELQQDVKAGQSLHQIAQVHNVTDQKVSDTMTAAFKARLDTAVTNGRITSAQEQTMLSNFQQRLPNLIAATPGTNEPGAVRRSRATATPGSQ